MPTGRKRQHGKDVGCPRIDLRFKVIPIKLLAGHAWTQTRHGQAYSKVSVERGTRTDKTVLKKKGRSKLEGTLSPGSTSPCTVAEAGTQRPRKSTESQAWLSADGPNGRLERRKAGGSSRAARTKASDPQSRSDTRCKN